MKKYIIYGLVLIVIFVFCMPEINAQQYGSNKNEYVQTKKIVFHEDFTTNKNKWPIFSSPQKFAKIKNGKYYLKATSESFQVKPQGINKPLPDNFEVEMRVLYQKGAENMLRMLTAHASGKSHLNPKKLAVLNQRLRSVFKPHKINKLTFKRLGSNYTIFLNNKLIRRGFTEKVSSRFFRINVARGTEMIIENIKISKIIIEETKNKQTETPKIIIYTPKTERGFVKLTNSELNNTQKNGVSVSGKIVPFESGLQFSLNNQPVNLQSSGNFQTMHFLHEGENFLVFELNQNGKLVDKKEIRVNYQPESENQEISNKHNSVTEKRLALVIGNAAYEFGGQLANPENDAQAIAQALRQTGFKVMEYTNLSQKDIKKAIDEFGEKLQSYDVGLFFYAGHGVQVKGSNYLVPVDANINSESDVEYDCVNAERVLARMEDAGSSVNIVILDACRNNPFERSWTRSTQGKGLAFMNAPSGSLIAYATSPGTTASDGSGSNGLYTSALLKHLATPGITILEMFQRVRATVMEESEDRQVPWESTSLRGNFYFVK
ncbi:MAG: caspase family protein [Bacteroidales bacterium]|nr:caspase family protein [Bacteroidales bacterium]